MIGIFPSIVREFIRALGKGYTYNVRRNYYAIFGILWGIPIPIVTIGIGLYFSGLPFSVSNVISLMTVYPIYLFFLFHPVMFGIVFGAMGTVRDEKEKQRLQFEKSLIQTNKELQKSNKKLQELDELKDNFLSMVSHELLSPLTTVQGYVTFVKEGKAGSLTEEQKEALDIAEEQTEHLKYLIEELMDLSKIAAGKFEVNPVSVEVSTVINRAVNNLKQLLNEKKIVLENRVPQGLPPVFADQERILQVFNNLLGNAIKFAPHGGKISIYAQVKDNKVEFCVEDNGTGIAKEKINRIFDRFYQVDSSARRQYGGCGLGLTITKSIVELHKGTIWVESETGRGSRFFFELKIYIGVKNGGKDIPEYIKIV